MPDLLDRGPTVGEILVLPDLVVLPEVGDPRRWHIESDGSLVIFVAHSSDCPGCIGYAEDLAVQTDEFGWWGGRSTVVLPAADAPSAELAERLALRCVADTEGSARHRWHLGTSDAAVIVADRWGQVYLVANAGDGHSLPEPASDVRRVLTRIGIQCPECGVPDVP